MVQCHSFANNSEQIHFEFVLTKGQVNAIEDYRLEGDLKLNVGLRALGGQLIIAVTDGLPEGRLDPLKT